MAYPAALDTAATLLVAVDLATSTLSSAMTASDTTAVLVDASLFDSNGGRIKADNEIIKYTGKTANTLTGLTRAYGNSTAAAHVAGTTVDLVIEADYHNALKDAIINVETKIGITGSETMIVIPASSVQGDTLYHNGTVYTRRAAGTSGYFLQTQGPSADPIWAEVPNATTGVKGLVQLAGDIGGTATAVTVTDLTIASEARGDLLMRGASVWARFIPGTSGLFVQSAGAGADLVWAAATPGTYTKIIDAPVSKVNTTLVTAWTDIDISVQTGGDTATWAMFSVRVSTMSSAPSDGMAAYIEFRKNGSASTTGLSRIQVAPHVANISNVASGFVLVPLDGAEICEFQVQELGSPVDTRQVNVWLVGYVI